MRKYFLIIVLLISYGLLLGKSYYVKEFVSEIALNKDGTLDIEEKWSYHFKGGPFRYVTRDVRAPRDGFIIWEKAFIDTLKIEPRDGGGLISYEYSNDLDIKFHLNEISDQDVDFILKYKVFNALTYKGDKAILDWLPLPNRYDFLIEKGSVTFTFPDEIPINQIVNFTEKVKGVTYEEVGNNLICKFKNLQGKSFRLESNLPLYKMSPKVYPSPFQEIKLRDRYPGYSFYVDFYKLLILAIIIYLICVIFILIRRYNLEIKSLPNITNLPSHKHPALVARLLQVGSDDLNLIPVLMYMAIKQLISFTQVTDKKGKLKKDYYIDIAENLSSADDIDQAYLTLLKKEEDRIQKRLVLKALITNSYRHKKEALKVINSKFDETGLVDVLKKKKYYKKVILFFIILVIGVIFTIMGAIFFVKGFSLAPLPAFSIIVYWIYLMLHLDDKSILSPLGLSKWKEWKAFKKYLSQALKGKKDQLSPNDAEEIFPYVLTMGYGQQYLHYFKKKNIDVNFPNLGEIADDIEALNAFITVLVVTSATSGASVGATGGGGGGGAGAG